MRTVIVTGLFTIAAVAVGAMLGAFITAVQKRGDARSASQAKAETLFIAFARGLATMETERAVFTERRDSRRASLIALGQLALHLLAARETGNWMSGAATGAGALVSMSAAVSSSSSLRSSLVANGERHRWTAITSS
jgi:hypothetical protein